MTTRDKLIEIITETLSKQFHINGFYNISSALADAILNSKLFCNSEILKEQEPHIYRWIAVEDDGYTHSEPGVANNMLDAFIKATEYSPSYHKKIVIEKISDDELVAKEKELKEFWTNEI